MGNDHAVTTRDDDTIIRRRLRPESAAMDFTHEAALLARVTQTLPLPVPEVQALSADGTSMIMSRVRGVPLLNSIADVRKADAARLGAQLGAFLTALHSIAADDVYDLVPVQPCPVGEYHADAVRIADTIRTELPGRVVGPVADFLAAPVPGSAHELRLCHNDLGAEHIFVTTPGLEISGIIDWSDAAISDPCLDLGLIWRDLGETGLAAALIRLQTDVGTDEGFLERAQFYARVRALEDFEFGLKNGRHDYLANATRALSRLF